MDEKKEQEKQVEQVEQEEQVAEVQVEQEEQAVEVKPEPINQAVKVRDLLIVLGIMAAIVFCMGKGMGLAANINSKYTNIELDAFAMVSVVEQVHKIGEDGWKDYRDYTMTYSDDKIIIESNYREDKYIPRADNLINPYERSWGLRPSHRSLPYFLASDGETIYIKVWLNTGLWPSEDDEKTLVYHSVLKPYDFCTFGFSQGKIRQEMLFRDGAWIDYLHQLTKETRREAYERLLPQIEDDELKKEAESDDFWNKINLSSKQKKRRAKAAEKLRKESQKVGEPVNDKEFFEKEN